MKTKETQKKARTLNAKQKRLLAALDLTVGNVSKACQKAKVGRKAHYQWLKENELYAERVEEINESLLDMSESKLLMQIQQDNMTAIMYHLNNKGQHRGYGNKQYIDHTSGGQPITPMVLQIGYED